jgi:hypothetical protein
MDSSIQTQAVQAELSGSLLNSNERKLWPIRSRPLPDELLSSWLVRLAHGHGLKVQTFCNLIFGNQLQVWNRDIDRHAPSWLLQELLRRTGIPWPTILETTLRAYESRLYRKFRSAGALQWVLSLKIYHRKRTGFGLQFCPLCLRSDRVPYYRKRWRVALSTVCPDHEVMLLDRCPECHASIAVHRVDMRDRTLSERALSYCHACGFDLSESQVVRPEYYDKAAADVLMAACSASDCAPRAQSEWDLDRLNALHHLCQILTSRYQHVWLRQFILGKLSEGDVPLTPGRISIEMRPVHERHHLVQLAAWLFVDIRARLTEAWYAGAVRHNLLLKDFSESPDWYRDIVDALPSWRARFIQKLHES